MNKLILVAFVCLLPPALHAQVAGHASAAVAVQDKSTSPPQQAELQEANKLSASVVQLYAARNYKEALPLAQRALALREKALKDEDPLVGAALANLVALYIALGDAGKAEPLCERILVRRERERGPTSKATMNVLIAYGCIVSAKGRSRVGNGMTLSERINKVLLQDAIIAAGLTPPASLEGVGGRISSPPPRYPVEARDFRMQGSVFLALDVDGAGKVTNVEPVACSPGHKLLADAASEASLRSTFAPVSIDGKFISRKAYAIYNFVLQ